MPENWLEELAKEISEAKWEINSIHNDPYPSAHSPDTTLGFDKVRKPPSDHLHQTPRGPQNKTSISHCNGLAAFILANS